ncbi:MAG: DUF4982 domain-containing protein [Prevotellaceae bacterium]|nr:DUF4982 domain-containing protein [Prevotellaceae bacterium]
MKKRILILPISIGIICLSLQAQAVRKEFLLRKSWSFSKGDFPNAAAEKFDDAMWKKVTIPHDWAIYGPFDRSYDLQEVAITQNGEIGASAKTGRTGGLPYMGIGWYRTVFDVDDFEKKQKNVSLLFDGAMSEARVYVNGREACYWPYGYSSFHCDVTDLLHDDGKSNTLAVRLENRPQSSRWYPGAGLYRNVHVIVTEKAHVPIWGAYITTPYVSDEYASVKLKTELVNVSGKEVKIVAEIWDKDGHVVARKESRQKIHSDRPLEQNFIVSNPQLWSPENPYLYCAVSKIYKDEQLTDSCAIRFGIRDIKLIADKGFFLNGKKRKFRGVCNHHDLGPLGAAVSEAALRRQLTLLKDMGCDAVRTTHNMPAPELVRLCDEMGFMMLIEPFDEWDVAKCKNGYHRFFNEWAEKDMVSMLRQYRNSASVVMWSIGNEVPTQCREDGYKVASFLQNICHREDPTRPVTCGIDQVDCALNNGFAALLDVPGFNYRIHRYGEAYEKLPQNLLLGSETASTVSSRGVYKFPAEKKANAVYDDHQSTSYDMERCSWSNLPDEDFAQADDHEWTLGQFVWTGFDYLGEPTPYDTDGWPSHSSMFGIIDLAGIPKDRYYLYRSVWNKDENTLHLLPHWSWEGREGQKTPVFAYTNHPSAELFINGKSQGKQSKNSATLQNRYRLMWTDVVYEPGEVKVVAYDAQGKAAGEKIIRTAGKPHHIQLSADRTQLMPDGNDLAYIRVSVVDKDGNLCPNDNRLITFTVAGEGRFKASANGNPACLDLFHLPQMHAFSGELTAIVQSGEKAGKILVEAKAKGLGKGQIQILAKQIEEN